jgi:polar amino acid transport system permease protein
MSTLDGRVARRASDLPTTVERRRHPGQAVAFVIVVLIIARIVYIVAQDPKLKWSTWNEYVLSGKVLRGLGTTLELAVISMAIGILIGVVVAIMRLSSNRYLRGVSWTYIWVFRSVPLLLQVLIWGNLGLFFGRLYLQVPFTHVAIISLSTNSVFTPFVASIVALALHEGPYMGEIVRGGVLAVPTGQVEATQALALSRGQALRHVILPQALRVIVPPTGNQVINLLKATSLVSVVAGGDLLTVTSNIAANNFRTVELLFVAAFWYLVVTAVAGVGQSALERRTQRSSRTSSVRTGDQPGPAVALSNDGSL